MKHYRLQTLWLTAAMLVLIPIQAKENKSLIMWYDQPATVWEEALPTGNGRIGAMIYGQPAHETIQLNEESFWSGGPSRNDNPDGLIGLDSIRQTIFERDYKRADALSNRYLTAKQLHGSKYQTIGALNLRFPQAENYQNYYRELDLSKAVYKSTYQANGVNYQREVFTSFPDQVVVIRLTASRKASISFTATFEGPLQTGKRCLDDRTLEMTGLSSTHEGVTGQVKFNTRASIMPKGGSIKAAGDSIIVENANEVLILVSIATNFTDYRHLTTNETEKCQQYLDAAAKEPFKKMLKNHIAVYQPYFNRVSFDLGRSEAANQPTNVRIKHFAQSDDPELISLYYQFGRYLLICSSQPGGQPANLQGIWNGSANPAWDSKYTININTEMNYWPAEKCNLTEMHEPLIQMLRELSESAQGTAKNMYGCDGWVAHHNTDIWRISGVVDFANAGQWPMGSAWLSQHLWEKYLYSGDTAYLASVYPMLKSACIFYQDFLIEEPSHQWLVVSPSVSPENTPKGHGSALSAGTTMDNQLLFDLFTKTIRAANILHKDNDLMADFQQIVERLAPMQIGQYGQLQEWMYDWDDPNSQHRHISHLYGLYPSNQISPYSSPELFSAAQTTLTQRGDVSTGWSMGWKVNFWARMQDGNHARKLISDQLTLVEKTSGWGGNGGTYANFFDAHPPFQIDGNFGCTAGIAEMLMQCQDGAIHILPALPDDWKSGSIKGLRAYGGFDVDIIWENNQVQQVVITSHLGGNCRIRSAQLLTAPKAKLQTAEGENTNPFYARPQIKQALISEKAQLKELNITDTYVYDFPTEAGKKYLLKGE